MKRKRRHGWPRRVRTGGLLVAAAVVALLPAPPAGAGDFEKGRLFGSIDTTISFGVSYRLEDPDRALIGIANGGTAFSVNGDDGNLNYPKGLTSQVGKVTSELELNCGNFGLFVRGLAFYDFENSDRFRERTVLTDDAVKLVARETDILDAYIRTRFDIGNKPAEIRIGEQVVSWGESTFIQNGINTINPFDVSKLRVPGAELREALLPEGLVWTSFALTDNTSLEAFWLYDWDETEIDPPGTLFSTNDFAGDGGTTVFLGFGDSGDIPPFSDPTAPTRPFLGVPRKLDEQPDDGGQYGAAFRWFVPALADTEFGFYYVNYHSRLPIINGVTGTPAGALGAGTIAAAATPIATAVGAALAADPTDIPGAIAAGVAAGLGAGAPLGASQAIAATAATDPASVPRVTSAFATDAYAQTAGYFISYPEDIKLYGVSFNAQIGTTGIALQGEVSHRQDVPLQVDDVELLFAALSPISPVFAGTSGIPGEPGASQLGKYRSVDYSTMFETKIPGFVPSDVTQAQTTVTKIFGPGLGIDQTVLLWEGAVTLADIPDKNRLRLEAPGTYVSGNPYHSDGANPGAAHVGKPAEEDRYFADSTSWGYRIAARFDFNNAIGAFNVSPRIQWQHDVDGNSPGPGGPFLEDRKAVTIGAEATYQNSWAVDLAFTRFLSSDRHNLINDRDFVAANVKYSF